MFSIVKTVGAATAAALVLMPLAGPALADDAMKPMSPEMSAQQTYKEIESSLGGVPTFIKLFPKGAVAGAWAEERDLELSDKTALTPKVKALISLAVAAQIPCQYCIWSDTEDAKRFGASQEEIAEAVAMAGLTRHWSTFFNGMQLDFEQFKKELGGQ
ncbi:MAG TPA: carboxymuconolactone decarboxylase family protein [Devosiaceae bacterium]|jgi:AhpD family alkylhydroperoxidase|nr:carboxymuconolactone decarboxylase family protein [Devosiaceae bacterium]